MKDVHFGTFLKELRKDRKLTQRQVSEFLNINVNSYGSYEKGYFPSFDFVLKVLDQYNYTLIDLHNFLNQGDKT